MLSSTLQPVEQSSDLAPAQVGTNGSSQLIPLASAMGTGPQARSQTQRAQAFRQTLERHRGDRHLLILQDFPDPDALSSAWAYKLIAQQFEIQSDLVYAGTLSHQENIALVKLTGLPVQRCACQSPKAKAKDLSPYQGCVLIDNQGTTSQLLHWCNKLRFL